MSAWHRINTHNLPLLEKHYSRFEPYCHFNIVDLWSYRGGTNYWMKNGDTIAYKLNDYMDNSYYVTLLGKNSVRDTIKKIAGSDRSGSKTLTMKCVPDTVIDLIKDWGPVISCDEDVDNHDYVFDINRLTSLNHPRIKAYKKFSRKYSELRLVPLDRRKPADRRRLYSMFKRWLYQNNPDDWHKEYRAFIRALNQKYVKLDCLAFIDGKKIVGFTINSAEKSGFYQAFFGKSDRRYPNLALFQEIETAKYMQAKYGVRYMNLQPDSGIEGLRKFKQSLRPTRMLKKYTVTIDVTKL
jgi:hypothetical protein